MYSCKHRPKSPTGNPDDWIEFTYWDSIIDSNLNPDEEIYFYTGFGEQQPPGDEDGYDDEGGDQ